LNNLCIDQNRSFRIEIWPRLITQKFLDMEIILLKLTVNGKSGRGILLRAFDHSLLPSPRFSSLTDTSILSSAEIKEEKIRAQRRESGRAFNPPEIVSFLSEHGRDVGVVGGKGASLAQLHHVSQTFGNVRMRRKMIQVGML